MRFRPHRSVAVQALAALVTMLTAASPVLSQTAIRTPGAMQTSPDVLLFRQLLEFQHLENDPNVPGREIDLWKTSSILDYGLARGLDLVVKVSSESSKETAPLGGDRTHLMGDAHVMLKRALLVENTGPIDTRKITAMFGLDLPTGVDPNTRDALNPMLGAAFMQVRSRHGLSAGVRWTWNNGDPTPNPTTFGDAGEDYLQWDAAYLYRIDPAVYSARDVDATYLVCELSGVHESNGDRQVFLSPGILYEAREWALEVSLQLPVDQALDHRPETEFGVTVGMRFLF